MFFYLLYLEVVKNKLYTYTIKIEEEYLDFFCNRKKSYYKNSDILYRIKKQYNEEDIIKQKIYLFKSELFSWNFCFSQIYNGKQKDKLNISDVGKNLYIYYPLKRNYYFLNFYFNRLIEKFRNKKKLIIKTNLEKSKSRIKRKSIKYIKKIQKYYC